jgi:hypothetical protein
MDRTDGLWFLMTLPLLPMVACTGGGATDAGTDETTTNDSSTGSSGGSTSDGSTTTATDSTGSGGSSTGGGSSTSDPSTTSSETTPSDDSTTYGCDETGDPCSEAAAICIAYEAHEEKCSGVPDDDDFEYCMHYVEDGGYTGEPCLPVAAEYFTCISMLDCRPDGIPDCDQKAFVTACGHA